MFRMLLLLLIGILSVSPFCASIPAKHDGFWYQNRPAKADSVLIEAFFDPVCPDSRDAWKPLKQAVNHYGSRVSLVVHAFPLPYHANAFVCSRALHVAEKLNSSATYPLLEAFFDQQKRFYTQSTANLTRNDVVDNIVKFAARTIGSSLFSAVKKGFNDTKTDQAARTAFKYGCLRGVYGTPYFFVNGFPLPDAGSPLSYKGWTHIIDPLVGHATAEERGGGPIHFF